MNWKYILIVALGLTSFGCTKKGTTTDNSRNLISPLSNEQEILSYSGGSVTVGDIEDKMKPHLEKARETLFNAYIMEAEKVFLERNQDRIKAEVTVTDEEVKKYSIANKISDVSTDKIKEFLLNEKMRLQKQMGLEKLKTELNLKNKLGAALFEAKVTESSPTKGSDSAKVKLQVFCDFANGMCNRLRLVLGQAEAQFANKIQWYYRHFPVPSNPGAYESANIAICASKQGKFWEAYEVLNNQEGNLQGKDLRGLVKEAGVSLDALDSCLNANEADSTLQADLKAAADIGIGETPTILINGQKIKDIDQVIPTIKSLL